MKIFIFILILFLIIINLKSNLDFFSNSKIKYSIHGKKDGFGAQYQAILSGIAWANYKNYEYVHKPLNKISHNQKKDELNDFIGIPYKNNSKSDLIQKYSSEVHFSKIPDIYYTPEILKKIRNYYYSTSKPLIKNNNYIAIHIRRGDVDKSNMKRYTDSNYYKKIIMFLKKKYPNIKIKIFSQGKLEDFKDLDNNCIFELNKDIKYTFHSMVIAKVLVTAKSSFSYCAGLLNENEIYYINFWHKPLKKWKLIENYIK
tara:strand:- start:281 stop:1051 length:771 start_codon:yes stop_codon:yes gene_type:complete